MTHASQRRTRRTKRGSRHEVRAWLGKDLYDRLSREAAARELNLSQCVREILNSYFEIERERAGASTGSVRDGRTLDTQPFSAMLEATELRMSALLQERGEELAALDSTICVLAAMIQQAYLGLIARLPTIPKSERRERDQIARQALLAWLDSVEGVVQSNQSAVLHALEAARRGR